MTMLAQVLIGAFVGLLFADHYKTDRLKTILSSIVLGFINVWIFLHLTVRKGWSTGKAVGAIVIGYLLLFWIVFTFALLIGLANAGTVVRS